MKTLFEVFLLIVMAAWAAAEFYFRIDASVLSAVILVGLLFYFIYYPDREAASGKDTK